jgi:hypothetical protein
MELSGFEPLTPSMPLRCATNCAIAPYVNQIRITLLLLEKSNIHEDFNHALGMNAKSSQSLKSFSSIIATIWAQLSLKALK